MARRSIQIDGFGHLNPLPAASRIGNLVASSVIGGMDRGTRDFPESFAGQCANVFAHMRAIIEAAGATPADVIKVNFYVAELERRAEINPLWVELFPDEDSRPARHTQLQQLDPPRLVCADFLALIER